MIFISLLALLYSGSIELTWPKQAVLGVISVLIAVWMDRSSSSYLITLTLMLSSCFSTFRYAWWRISTVVEFFRDSKLAVGLPGCLLHPHPAHGGILCVRDSLPGICPDTLAASQNSLPLPDDPEEWPVIDLLIPTYNEPLSIVRYTALAAMNIDWPADKTERVHP